jgi:osmotically-inducible protein OsmY
MTRLTSAITPAEQAAGTPGASEAALEVARELQRQRKLGNLKEFKIRVTVEDGIAVLDGRVASAKQREMALQIARKNEEVREVVDNLMVVEGQPGPKPEEADREQVAAAHAGADEKKETSANVETARRIAAELNRQKASGNLKGFRIELTVENGVATLNGRVASEEQRQMAADAANGTEGVREVVNKLSVLQQPPTNKQADAATSDEPTPAKDLDVLGDKVAIESGATLEEEKIGDEEIARQIVEALNRQKELGSLTGFGIDVAVDNGVVRLDGHVSTAEQLDLTMDIARHTSGVRDVVSHLAINERPVSEPRETATRRPRMLARGEAPRRLPLLHAVSRFLKRDVRRPEATNRDISADTSVAGADTSVDSDELTEGIPSRMVNFGLTPAEPATAVENAIYRPDEAAEPEPAPFERDQQIGEELMKRLNQARQEGNLRGFGIGVRVGSGSVHLTGSVASPEQQQLALDIARNIPRVREVVNELTIAEAPLPETDNRAAEMIAQELGERLRAEEAQGRLQDCDFEVKVDGRDVWLSGAVATADQKQLAIEMARRVPGVQRVVNALTVEGPSPLTNPVPDPSATPEANLANAASKTPIDAGPASGATASAQGAEVSLAAMQYGPEAGSMPLAATAVRGLRAAPAMALGLDAGSADSRQVQPAARNIVVANQTPLPLGAARMVAYGGAAAMAAPILAIGQAAGAMPPHLPGPGHAVVPARYDHPSLPGYAWPTYGAYPNYGAVTYPKQYSPTAWPYIGPFYPYPQVPLGWRRVQLKWDDGWWQLNFKSK